MRMKRLSLQLPAYWSEYARPARLQLVIDEYGGVLVETDIAAVGPTLFFPGPDDDTLHHVALFHVGTGDGVLDGGDEDVPDRGVPPLETRPGP